MKKIVIVLLLLSLVLPFLAVVTTNYITNEYENLLTISGFIYCYRIVFNAPYSYVYLLAAMLIASVALQPSSKEMKGKLGKGEFGTSRFQTKKEKLESTILWNTKDPLPKSASGVIFGIDEKQKGENVYIQKAEDNEHTMIIGSTGTGKTRGVLYPAIWALAKTKESLVINDTKEELFYGTCEYLEKEGYEVIRYNLKDTQDGQRNNPISKVNHYYKLCEYDEATSRANEIATMLVRNELKGNTGGENAYFYQAAISCITSVILWVCEKAPKEEQINLATVYHNLVSLAALEMDSNKNLSIKLKKVIRMLPDDHPAKLQFATVDSATGKTESSIISTALNALSIFAQSGIQYLTSENDFELEEIGERPIALFLITPDEKPSRHILTSLMVTQLYSELITKASQYGGTLPNRVNLLLDEFSALPHILDFDGNMSRARSFNMRYYIAVQDDAQLEKKYTKSEAKTIRGQCNNIIYVGTNDNDTAKYVQDRMGKSTIEYKNRSSSSKSSTINNASSTDTQGISVTGRFIMDYNEVQRLPKGKSIVILPKAQPALFTTPDLAKLSANKDFGMGNKEHNRQLFLKRATERKNVINRGECEIWKYTENYREGNENPRINLRRLSGVLK